MIRLFVTTILLWIGVLPVLAQDLQVRLADTGVASHSSHGTGIEMQFEIRGMRIRDVPDEFLKELCDQFSPDIVPTVLQQNPQLNPDFIGVRIISGGTVGNYAFEGFELDGAGCGVVK